MLSSLQLLILKYFRDRDIQIGGIRNPMKKTSLPVLICPGKNVGGNAHWAYITNYSVPNREEANVVLKSSLRIRLSLGKRPHLGMVRAFSVRK